MDVVKLAQLLDRDVKGNLKINEEMKKHTTFKVGGPADILLHPADWIDLEKVLKFASANKLPVTIIGGGSNVLVADEGIRGIVIKLAGALKEFAINGEYITAQAGVKLPLLAKKVSDKGLSGLEFAVGIPGTLGGAVIMNAGAHGASIADVIQGVAVMDYQGRLINYDAKDIQFAYRSSSLKKMDVIVIEVSLKLNSSELSEIQNKISKNLQQRQIKQPLDFPNAGSVFKNPEGDSAGRLIESIGAKGWQIGGAKVSEKHANFIVNTGNASCRDIIQLMEKIQEKINNEYDLFLEPEIRILGG